MVDTSIIKAYYYYCPTCNNCLMIPNKLHRDKEVLCVECGSYYFVDKQTGKRKSDKK